MTTSDRGTKTPSDIAAKPKVTREFKIRFSEDLAFLDNLFGPETDNENQAEVVIMPATEEEPWEGPREDDYGETEEGYVNAERDLLKTEMLSHGVITNVGRCLLGSQMAELIAITHRMLKYEEDIMDRAMEMLKEGIVIPWDLEEETLPYSYKDLNFIHQGVLFEYRGEDDDSKDLRNFLWLPMMDFDEGKEKLLEKDDKFKELWHEHVKMLAESATATHKEKKFLRNLEVPSLAIPAELDEDEIFSAEQEENSQVARTPRASQSFSDTSWIARLDSQNKSQFTESQF